MYKTLRKKHLDLLLHFVPFKSYSDNIRRKAELSIFLAGSAFYLKFFCYDERVIWKAVYFPVFSYKFINLYEWLLIWATGFPAWFTGAEQFSDSCRTLDY